MATDQTNDVMNELRAGWTPEMGNAGTSAAPEGDAVLKIVNAYVSRSQNGRKQITFQCEVISHTTDPTAAGTKIGRPQYGLETIQDFKRLNTALVNLQLPEIKKPDDILSTVRDVVGICFNGKIVKQEDPQFPPNVYINPGARRKDLEAGAGKTDASAKKGDQL